MPELRRLFTFLDDLVPAVVVPWVGGFGEGITAVGRHSEIVDPYRTGLPGEADCEPIAP